MATTVRLFWKDPYLKEFSAKVVRSFVFNKKPAVILSETAFYPTSGGQPNDEGILNGVKVVDVIEEKDEIIHILEKPLLKEGEEVSGSINFERRLDHMVQHHGQHILSKAFIDVANAQTVSFHLGPNYSYIDLDKRDEINEEAQEKALKIANRAVFENRAVSTTFYDSIEEASKLPLRKLDPTLQAPIRIVNIDGFDLQACCGTHPAFTGQVMCINIINFEKIKKTTRITFLCGMRAINKATEAFLSLKRIALKVAMPIDCPAIEKSLDSMIDDNQKLRKVQSEYEKLLQRTCMQNLLQTISVPPGSFGKYVFELPGKDMNFIKSVGKGLVEEVRTVICLLVPLPLEGKPTTIGFYMTCSNDIEIDLRVLLKEIFSLQAGKGGGDQRTVQGSFNTGDLELVKDAVKTKLNAVN
eukprot:TRINITY_DN948_c0_g1_i5.p1 TRINITY_DN948_c0_g1~~TRINITY_DN948_c0_g1_i5.p1  ORF type:complete len:413 (+),score=100.24 TRINITY_DN948_c0_g1_i5:119-1357(+)